MPTEQEKLEAAQAAVPELKDDAEIERFVRLFWSQVPLLVGEPQGTGAIGAVAISGPLPEDLANQLKPWIHKALEEGKS